MFYICCKLPRVAEETQSSDGQGINNKMMMMMMMMMMMQQGKKPEARLSHSFIAGLAQNNVLQPNSYAFNFSAKDVSDKLKLIYRLLHIKTHSTPDVTGESCRNFLDHFATLAEKSSAPILNIHRCEARPQGRVQICCAA